MRGRDGRRGGIGGPKLPSALLAEVDATYGTAFLIFEQVVDPLTLLTGTPKQHGKDDRPRKERRISGRGEQRRHPTEGRRHMSSEDEGDIDEPTHPHTLEARRKTRPNSPTREDSPPKKKKRKSLPEIALPSNAIVDAEDEEIEWLEWVLKKEKKGKGKAMQDDVELDDGLDGEAAHSTPRRPLMIG